MSPKSITPAAPTTQIAPLTLEQARIMVEKDKARRARVSARRRAKLRDAKAMVKAADASKA